MTGDETVTDGAVVIGDRTVDWVGPVSALPAEYLSLPPAGYRGSTIMPGLIDSHVHLAFDGGPNPAARMRADTGEQQLMLMLRSAGTARRRRDHSPGPGLSRLSCCGGATRPCATCAGSSPGAATTCPTAAGSTSAHPGPLMHRQATPLTFGWSPKQPGAAIRLSSGGSHRKSHSPVVSNTHQCLGSPPAGGIPVAGGAGL